MNRSESKYFATAARMDEAFLTILAKKDLAYITVKEICAAANVNRSTFYLHYETIADLLKESIAYMNKQFYEHMGKSDIAPVTNLNDCPLDELNFITPEYLIPYLEYVKQHRRLFRAATEKADILDADETYDRMFRRVFAPILARHNVPEAGRAYIMTFYIRGIMAVITRWLENDCADTVEYIASIIEGCVRPA